MSSDVPLGRYLSARWVALGIRQAEFARRVGLYPAHVQQIRVGKRKPPLRSHARWARALDLERPADLDRLLELMQLAHALRVTQVAYERLREQVVQQDSS